MWIFLSKVRHDSSESTPLIPGQSTPLSWPKVADFGKLLCEFSEVWMLRKGRFLSKVRHLFLLKVRH